MHVGISTYIFRHEPLGRYQLESIARHGFTSVELFASPAHVDYHDPATVSQLAAWFDETGLVLDAIRTTVQVPADGPPTSIPLAESAGRVAAVQELDALLAITQAIDVRCLVVDFAVGTPGPAPTRNRSAVLRTIDTVLRLTEARGVQVAMTIGPHEPWTPAGLARTLDDLPHEGRAGACLDFGEAFRQGDVVDVIETLSGHLLATRVHDARERSRERLMPFDGRMDWPAIVLALRKVGYDGPLMLDPDGSPAESLMARAAHVARELERLMADEWPE